MNSSASASADKAYDEERLAWGGSVTKKYLQLPRLRRVSIYLLLADVFIVAFLVHAFEPLITLLVRNEELFGSRLVLPLNETLHPKPPAALNKIPRILHQTSATEIIPDKWIHLQKSCKETYSEFEYKHWTDELARDFIAAEYPWFVDTWDNYAFPIQRADAIRYFVLHEYGGIYLDMDTLCNETIPFHLLESDGEAHHAVFKSTTPTGVSNDLMISSPRHPAFKTALDNLLFYNEITRFWAPLLPHAAIMVGSGPFFLTMSVKNYLLQRPAPPASSVQVVNATELAPYITDLEDSSWHHGDTSTLMFVGDRPWIWFGLGALGLGIGLHIINQGLLLACKGLGKLPSVTSIKVAKLI
ncbi:nucleotide-diphospho-sugar transferase [Ilyonectria robusta]|uniref:nucleotide-diphospho-sugar transferase n=1 Tax=Ilyonectria robusta TaxID=1079257 RepID=UPI001E8DC8C3|nr:nucleotide-diphospho-sugar transferase [Ilyonectria robusta]KAH8672365.1 nucleotide-diphospho-sugar transferase [Ilyonectria robusta]